MPKSHKNAFCQLLSWSQLVIEGIGESFIVLRADPDIFPRRFHHAFFPDFDCCCPAAVPGAPLAPSRGKPTRSATGLLGLLPANPQICQREAAAARQAGRGGQLTAPDAQAQERNARQPAAPFSRPKRKRSGDCDGTRAQRACFGLCERRRTPRKPTTPVRQQIPDQPNPVTDKEAAAGRLQHFRAVKSSAAREDQACEVARILAISAA